VRWYAVGTRPLDKVATPPPHNVRVRDGGIKKMFVVEMGWASENIFLVCRMPRITSRSTSRDLSPCRNLDIDNLERHNYFKLSIN
jgi:hypothetical protein